MIFNADYVAKQIRLYDYTHCKIFDSFASTKGKSKEGVVNNKGRRPIEVMKKFAPEEIISRIEDRESNYPGKYIIHLGHSETGVSTNPIPIKVDLIPQAEIIEDETTMKNETLQGIKDTLRLEITQEIQAENLRQLAEAKQQDLESELAELRTGSGKMAAVLYDLVNQFMSGGQQVAPMAPLQGTYNKEELNEALKTLVNKLGVNTIINLSKKIDPAMVSMVQNYANT